MTSLARFRRVEPSARGKIGSSRGLKQLRLTLLVWRGLSMKQLFVFFLALLLPSVSHAGSDNDLWRWYYAAFASPEMSAAVFVRSGIASVNQSGGKIEIKFSEKNVPESAPVLVGHVSGEKVRGTLEKFFMHDDSLVLSGDLRSSQVAKDCSFDEIVLRTEAPTGSLLVLSRVTGNCQ